MGSINAPFLRVSLVRLAMVLALAAGSTGCRDRRAVIETVKPATDYYPLKVGDRTIRVQLMVLPAEIQQGMMGRTSLRSDDGMLFAHLRPGAQQYWMRNCPLPLDVGYFESDGVLKEFYPMYPYDERSVPSRSRQIQFVLEMNQGWYSANGVKPGAKLDLEGLKKALVARGFEPERFGLK